MLSLTLTGTMAVHLKNNTRVGEEEGAVLTDVTNQKAVATIATFIRAPRDHPMSAGSPVSFWSNCFIQANPKTGQLLELVQTSWLGLVHSTKYNASIGC